jgi:hypothetical protein
MGTGCGGGGGGSSSPTGPVTTIVVDDQALAQRANLKLADFPPEWKSAPPAPANDEADNALADCMGRPRPDQTRTATADSQDFSAAETRRASSTVQVVRTVEIAQGDFAALHGERAAPCLKQQIDAEFTRQLPPDAPAQATTIERVDLPQFGEETVVYRVQATAMTQGQQVRTYIDLAFVRMGRSELSAAFLNRSTPFPADLQRTLLQRMVGRA